jgi:hypothetical protein
LFVIDACCLVSSPGQNIALFMLAQVFVISVLCRGEGTWDLSLRRTWVRKANPVR